MPKWLQHDEKAKNFPSQFLITCDLEEKEYLYRLRVNVSELELC
jgi:hypothetical protein